MYMCIHIYIYINNTNNTNILYTYINNTVRILIYKQHTKYNDTNNNTDNYTK